VHTKFEQLLLEKFVKCSSNKLAVLAYATAKFQNFRWFFFHGNSKTNTKVVFEKVNEASCVKFGTALEPRQIFKDDVNVFSSISTVICFMMAGSQRLRKSLQKYHMLY
jgi:hypothetical protein